MSYLSQALARLEAEVSAVASDRDQATRQPADGGLAAPVSPAGPSHPRPAASDPQADRSPGPAADATSPLGASSRPEIGPGDIVVAVLAGRPTVCAVQRVRRADAVAIVRPLDRLDRYDRVPAQDLRRVAGYEAIVRWAQP